MSSIPQLTTIEIAKQQYHFSAAHFTIFSATERERLHGHNFRLAASITGIVGENGLCFDYAIIKKRLIEFCEKYDEYTLIAEQSPYLTIQDKHNYYHIQHADDTLILLKKETILLPIRNITIEELSRYFLDQLLLEKQLIKELKITKIIMKISSGPEQWGVSIWEGGDAL